MRKLFLKKNLNQDPDNQVLYHFFKKVCSGLIYFFMLQTLSINAQNVGIDVVTPTEKLDVAGNLNVQAGSSYKIGGKRIVHKTGGSNIAVGEDAGAVVGAGQQNTFVGRDAGSSTLNGDDNTLIGASAGRSIMNTDGNTLVGANAGFFNTGGDNTFMGRSAGDNNLGGSSNTFIGAFADGNNGGNLTNATAIGANSKVECSDCLVLGGTGISAVNVGIGTANPAERLHVIGNICATGSIGSCSDRRYKQNIMPLTHALRNLRLLSGVSYFWKTKTFPEHEFTTDRQIGFIAQEVEQIYPEMVQTGTDGYKSVDYAKLTPVLVEAVKEQQNQIDNLENRVTELEKLVKQFLEN